MSSRSGVSTPRSARTRLDEPSEIDAASRHWSAALPNRRCIITAAEPVPGRDRAAARAEDPATHAIEIERKYRLRAVPTPDVLAAHGAVALRIEQTYLAAGEGIRRVRRTERPTGEVEHRLTTKRRIAAFSFDEDERPIAVAEYRRLLAQADPARRPIRKVRHVVPEGDRKLEIDVFEEPPGLVLLEIELGSADETVTLPDWLGEWREVTGDPAYFNASLARRGTVVPPW
jgi:CYTH domain-containing protein